MYNELQKLFDDLEHLNGRIAQSVQATDISGTNDPALALVRIVKGMSPDTWKTMQGQEQFPQWLAIPVQQNTKTSLQIIQEQLDSLAFQKDHDPLTGLPNRNVFDIAMERELERAYRFKTPVSLCILDLDDFKKINDTYGHLCGDLVLKAFAGVLTEVLRQIDVAARIGGEEFGLIFTGTGMVRSQQLIHRLQTGIRSLQVACPELPAPIKVTCSIGLATTRGRKRIPSASFFQAADQALYQAKAKGKNTFETAPLLDLPPIRQETLVLQEEKQFLFAKKNNQ